jgi:hypothetical protein
MINFGQKGGGVPPFKSAKCCKLPPHSVDYDRQGVLKIDSWKIYYAKYININKIPIGHIPHLSPIFDWLIIYCFTYSRSFNVLVYGDISTADEGLAAKYSLCWALRAFRQEGSLSCHISCDTGPRFFRSHPKNRPIQSPLTTHKGM